MRNQVDVGTILPYRPHARNERDTSRNHLNISVLWPLRGCVKMHFGRVTTLLPLQGALMLPSVSQGDALG